MTEDLGRRKGQRVAEQPVQHPLALPVFETRDVSRRILSLIEGEKAGEDPIGQIVDLLTEVAATQALLLQRLDAIERRLPGQSQPGASERRRQQ
jgi:hypothetical protein